MFGKAKDAARSLVNLARETIKVSKVVIRFQTSQDAIKTAIAEMDGEANAVLVKVVLGDANVSALACLQDRSTLNRKELEALICELLNVALGDVIAIGRAKMAAERAAQAEPTSEG
jgi:hypothetical protein